MNRGDNRDDQAASQAARAKLGAIAISLVGSLIYCWFTLWLIGGRIGGWVYLQLVAAVVLFVLGVIDPKPMNQLFKVFPEGWIQRESQALSVIVFGLTFFYVTLVATFCYYTGGPVKSPYATILLTIAVLAPFVVEDKAWQPIFAILTFVVVAYLVCYAFVWWLEPTTPDIPDELEITTSIVGVGISIVLMFFKQRADELRNSSTAPERRAS